MRVMGLFVVVAVLALSAVPSQAGYESLFKKAQAAAWGIYVRSQGGMSATCSATAYQSDGTRTLMVTAGHCFVGSSSKTDFLVTQNHLTFFQASLVRSGLKLKQGANASSESLSDYDGDDWAVIQARIGGKPVMPIGRSADLVIGEDLVMVGVPLGLDFMAVQGIVGSTDVSLSQTTWNHYLGANIFTAAGNSGSGVISTKQQAVVGIMVAGPGMQSSMAIFAPIDIVALP